MKKGACGRWTWAGCLLRSHPLAPLDRAGDLLRAARLTGDQRNRSLDGRGDATGVRIAIASAR